MSLSSGLHDSNSQQFKSVKKTATVSSTLITESNETPTRSMLSSKIGFVCGWPTDCRTAPSVNTFKIRLKTFLFDSA